MLREQSEGSNQDDPDCYWTILLAQHCFFSNVLLLYLFANIAFLFTMVMLLAATHTHINKTIMKSNHTISIAITPLKASMLSKPDAPGAIGMAQIATFRLLKCTGHLFQYCSRLLNSKDCFWTLLCFCSHCSFTMVVLLCLRQLAIKPI